jgi:hypothetical protein
MEMLLYLYLHCNIIKYIHGTEWRDMSIIFFDPKCLMPLCATAQRGIRFKSDKKSDYMDSIFSASFLYASMT